MLLSSVPYKFSVPWGSSATTGYITSPIPATASGGNASQALGFPPDTAAPVGSGGIPPDIADFNGFGSYVTTWLQWIQAGGPMQYDAAFSTAIGGYPKGATLANAATPGLFWISSVDSNTTDPDTGGAGWIGFPTAAIAVETARALDAEALLTPLADFGCVLSGSGYQKMPSGLIVQWGSGTCTTSQTAQSFSFPIPFPNAFLRAVASSLSLNSYAGYVDAFTTNNAISLFSSNSGGAVSYVAFGH